MKQMTIRGRHGDCQVFAGESIDALSRHVPDNKPLFILTDQRVQSLYGDGFPPARIYAVPPGEGAKSLATVEAIVRWLQQHGAGRHAFLLGIGGGVVCDLTGFVASIYMRGLAFGLVPTTLLAQVDAALGGKNGINLDQYKNILGCINQPLFVLSDPAVLSSLSPEEVRNGLAEVVKHALIADENLLLRLEQDPGQAKDLAPAMLDYMVWRSVCIKSDIVMADELESGLRRKLNFGHSLGHAIEKVVGWPHGQAVAVGMQFAAALSVHLGLLDPSVAHRLTALLQKLGLPTRVTAKPASLLEAMTKDKKTEGPSIHFVLLTGPGRSEVRVLALEEISLFLHQWMHA